MSAGTTTGNDVFERCRIALESEREELGRAIDELAGADDDDEGLTDHMREHLKVVEDALYRLHHGTFGTCEACKDKIADEHLLETPAARHCFSCADARRPVITGDPEVE